MTEESVRFRFALLIRVKGDAMFRAKYGIHT